MNNIKEYLVKKRQELYINIIKKVFKLLTNYYNFKISKDKLNQININKNIYI